jgi:hypothetical protein
LKLIGAFLIFLAVHGFQTEVTASNLSWLLIGVILVGIEEFAVIFKRKGRR